MIIAVIVTLFILAFLWAFIALKKEEKVHGKVVHAKKELKKEKVLFRA